MWNHSRPDSQYAEWQMPGPAEPPVRAKGKLQWKLLLLLPYLGLLFPVVYARNAPALFGIPFFYWYQLLWVILASAIMGLVYRHLRD